MEGAAEILSIVILLSLKSLLSQFPVDLVKKLSFALCRMSLAGPGGLEDFGVGFGDGAVPDEVDQEGEIEAMQERAHAAAEAEADIDAAFARLVEEDGSVREALLAAARWLRASALDSASSWAAAGAAAAGSYLATLTTVALQGGISRVTGFLARAVLRGRVAGGRGILEFCLGCFGLCIF